MVISPAHHPYLASNFFSSNLVRSFVLPIYVSLTDFFGDLSQENSLNRGHYGSIISGIGFLPSFYGTFIICNLYIIALLHFLLFFNI